MRKILQESEGGKNIQPRQARDFQHSTPNVQHSTPFRRGQRDPGQPGAADLQTERFNPTLGMSRRRQTSRSVLHSPL